jgi:UrcA family protein
MAFVEQHCSFALPSVELSTVFAINRKCNARAIQPAYRLVRRTGLHQSLPSKDVGPPATLSHWPTVQRRSHDKQKDDQMATPKLFTICALAASALAISTPATAGWKTKHVKYDDLDLSTAQGQGRLKARVKQAVKQVCGDPRAITLKERADLSHCQTSALARAMPKVERRQLTD